MLTQMELMCLWVVDPENVCLVQSTQHFKLKFSLRSKACTADIQTETKYKVSPALGFPQKHTNQQQAAQNEGNTCTGAVKVEPQNETLWQCRLLHFTP